jgi:hypothetical protein
MAAAPPRVIVAIGAFAILALAAWLGVRATTDSDVDRGGAASEVVYMGSGIQSTPSFFLAGGSYRTQWSAWERAPEYPPCTHSAELMATDPANATTSGGHVIDLARSVQVPATGASAETYVVNVKPGAYYFAVNSECAWQIVITKN